MLYGLLNLPWWGDLIALLVLTQITIFSVTIYLHRCMAHRALELHPIVSHFFRLWLWMTTGMLTKEWTAVHRKHHAKVETEDDPHSPIKRGIWTVLFQGTELYRKETRNKETLERYGQGTPDDWVENNVYSRYSATGILIMLAIDLLLFGVIGLSIWAIQMAWIPFFAAGVVNGIGHYVGYRNFECADASRNIFPIGFFIGGEELHNNHHTYGTSARFSVRWWEVDVGWLVIRLLQFLGLAKPKRTPPKKALQAPGKLSVDADTLKAVLAHRFQVLAQYSRRVIVPVLKEERRRASEASQKLLRKARTLLIRESSLVAPQEQQQLTQVLESHRSLQTVYQFRLKLQNIWAKSTATQSELIESLQEWCRQAEEAGITALRDFVKQLKGYMPRTV
ncbi:MAG: fatty acid desaturase [Gammaproteobacteria bacterium]|nr:fatty acid desaturase [Gammaproteobacteria bacterium]